MIHNTARQPVLQDAHAGVEPAIRLTVRFRWPVIPRFLSRFLRALVLLLFAGSLFILLVFGRFNPPTTATLPARNPTAGGTIYTLNGFDLWCLTAGSDRREPPIIMLHAGTGYSSSALQTHFRYLEQSRRVIYYDQRGSGNSEVKPSLAHYTMNDLVEELDAVRRTVARSRRVVLLGHGIGGTLAKQYSIGFPNEVDRLILLSPVSPLRYRARTIPQFYADLFESVVEGGIPSDDPLEANQWYARCWRQTAVGQLYDKRNASLLPAFSGSFGPARALTASLASDGLTSHRGQPRLQTKTLIVYGSEEEAIREDQSEFLESFENATVITLKGSGYWTFIEQPDALQRIIQEFLDE